MAILTGEKLFDEIVSSQLDLTLSAQASGRLINRLDGLINEEGNVSPTAVARLLYGNSNIKEAIEDKNDSGEADSVFFQNLITTTRDDILDEDEDEDEGEGNGDDLSQLKDALLALDDTQADKDQFLVDALENDAVKQVAEGRLDFDDETAIDADITTVFNNAAGNIGAEIGIGGFDTKSAEMQDLLIDDMVSQKMAALNTAVLKAGSNSDTLLATVADKIEAVNAAAEAKTEAADDMTDAITGFENNNEGKYVDEVPDPDDVFVDKNQLIRYVNGTDDIVLAEKDSNVWTLTDKVVGTFAILSTTNLLDAYEAQQAAIAALASAHEALEDAVADVYLAENGGHSVYDFQAAVTYKVDGSVDTVDFNEDVKIFETEALADADAAGVKQIFTVKINDAGADGKVFKLGGEAIYTVNNGGQPDGDAIDTAAKIAAAFSTHDWGEAEAAWELDYTEGTAILTFTAKETTGDVADPTNGSTINNIDVTNDGTGGSIEGVKSGIGTGAVEHDAPFSNGVLIAQEAVKDFEDLKDAFESARDLRDQLDSHDQAIEDAKAWFADNDLTLPAILEHGGDESGTEAGDIYMATSLKGGQSASIDEFGDDGLDHLFIGDGLVRVDLAEDDAIADNLGDVAALEVFFEQVGDDLNLYIETQSYGGNLGDVSELAKITLTGVSSDDVALVDGFIIAGE